eukprot:2889262-Heterocapsa_arctica.AAC.1
MTHTAAAVPLFENLTEAQCHRHHTAQIMVSSKKNGDPSSSEMFVPRHLAIGGASLDVHTPEDAVPKQGRAALVRRHVLRVVAD